MEKATYVVKALFVVTNKYHRVTGGFLTRAEANYHAQILAGAHPDVTFCVHREEHREE